MAKYNTEEEINQKFHTEEAFQTEEALCSYYHVEKSDVMTGDSNHSRHLYYQLKMSMLHAVQMDVIVSFLMESGVKLILKDLKTALERGTKIRILTGNYLGITQPGALYLLKQELGEQVEIRFYKNKNRSFHPKAYIFHYEDMGVMYIGSSNVSKSALTSGIEWNYRISSNRDKYNFNMFCQTFEELYHNQSILLDNEELEKYARNWRRPSVYADLESYEQPEQTISEKKLQFEPRGVQIEALYALEQSRKEGANKGLIYAATGIGKTYLAAFDSMSYRRVLFVAHREEILQQAASSFQNVRNSKDYGFFDGKQRDRDKSVIFASVASLGKEKYLTKEYFKEDYFDYIIIDEFHHAVSEGYQRIIAFFKPKYLLGLTATPDRMDGRNIYKLCDYIVPYELSLKDAINKGVLVPFHYYGIYDNTVDYTQIHSIKGKYIEKELNEKLLIENRYSLIFKHYKKYRSQKALGFCCSRLHAEKMAKEFSQRGIASIAVYSNGYGEFSEKRDIAIEKLREGKIKVIFSVDMFNEGLDISAVDMVLFLRPTESPTIFLQQLGRGLRRDNCKKYLNVLDFIGNYKKAGLAPFLLSGQVYALETAQNTTLQDFEFPEECMVDFDLELIDLFQEIAKQGIRNKDRIKDEYYRVKDLLDGKVPSRMELYNLMEEEIYLLCFKNSKENLFHHYLDFLNEIGELDKEEILLYNSIGRSFLNTLETTSMVKSYKLPILSAFYNHGKIKLTISEEDVYQSYLTFYQQGVNWKDLEKDKSSKDYKNWDQKRYVKEANRNPIHYLKQSGNGFFVEREGWVLGLREELADVIHNTAFIKHMEDIINYRTMEYYRRRYKE